ncbi:MAG: hypothetical protein HN922_02665, partial [Anaerolineae bacterium]|nr:hypothetical protein [Anaerolineae bacterium]
PFLAILSFLAMGKILKKTRKTRKKNEAEITSQNIKTGKYENHEIQKWIRVKEHEIYIHKVTERFFISTKLSGKIKERILYVEVEYRNLSQEEEISCRRNQWLLFDQSGYSYEARTNRGAFKLYEGKPYFKEQALGFGRNARGWFAFPVSEDAEIIILQFKTAYIGAKTADFGIKEVIEQEAPNVEKARLTRAGSKDADAIINAANQFIETLPVDQISKSIILTAEMAGLKLLRATNIDLEKHNPGHILIGAISDEHYNELHNFIIGRALSFGIDIRRNQHVQIPEEAKEYTKNLIEFENTFDALCEANNIGVEFAPFVASLASLKLIPIENETEQGKLRVQLAKILFHIAMGSKTVPYPISNQK